MPQWPAPCFGNSNFKTVSCLSLEKNNSFQDKSEPKEQGQEAGPQQKPRKPYSQPSAPRLICFILASAGSLSRSLSGWCLCPQRTKSCLYPSRDSASLGLRQAANCGPAWGNEVKHQGNGCWATLGKGTD